MASVTPLVVTVELRLDPRKSIWDNLAVYHERAKKLKRKIKKLEELIANPPKEETGVQKEVLLVRKRKRDWYEKFRWGFTRGGFLLIGGRDARTNELLVRRYLEDTDLYFHANVVGAPSFVMKRGQEASEEDIFDAAILAAVYSKAWRSSVASVDVFYALPEQVSLAPPSGEYLEKGGVMVYGQKKWVRHVPMAAYVGFDEEKDRFYLSPFQKDSSVAITPGRVEKSEVARRLLKMFGKDKRYLDDLMSVLPPGPAEILGKGR